MCGRTDYYSAAFWQTSSQQESETSRSIAHTSGGWLLLGPRSHCNCTKASGCRPAAKHLLIFFIYINISNWPTASRLGSLRRSFQTGSSMKKPREPSAVFRGALSCKHSQAITEKRAEFSYAGPIRPRRGIRRDPNDEALPFTCSQHDNHSSHTFEEKHKRG